jgi:diguanylate cyclase (GGDEF)-like protein
MTPRHWQCRLFFESEREARMPLQNQSAKLKKLFSKRVTNQARIVLDSYQKCKESDWLEKERLNNLYDAAEKLKHSAERFEMLEQHEIANKITSLLKLLPSGAPTQESIETLDAFIQELNEQTLRKSDLEDSSTTTLSSEPRTFLRTPIYIALNNKEFANRIISQLDFFGFRSISFEKADNLIAASKQNKPETVVMDVDFGDHAMSGFEAAEALQSKHETPVPIIYLSTRLDDIQTRLRASRSGGEEFFYPSVDPGQLIEKIERYTHASPQEPYRVLVVDDSQSQARYIDTVLKKAGMHPLTITDPMKVLLALEEFHPEIIIMDMYMPGCTGMELARVIRQQDKFHSVPIIYLSAEDDINKQLHAMSQGGDDFLTKPIDPKHLTSTIHNRGRRARSLLALMIRDSLTGLYNHTHTLHLLEQEVLKTQDKEQPLSFVMLDLDHFKKVNDTYGHPMGDRVIKSLALFLKQRLRKTDHIGRYGGEEFAVVLPNTSEGDAKTIMSEIRERFSTLPQPCGNTSFCVSFSCGIATIDKGKQDANAKQICEKADQALYQAKHDGRNTVRSYIHDILQ